MKYKVVATDFDGTFLTSTKTISSNNISAMKACREQKCITVGVTARNLSSVESVCNIEIFDYLIVNNGTCIYDVKEDKAEHLGYLNDEIVRAITKEHLNQSEGIDYCTVRKYYSNKTVIRKTRPFHLEINNLSEVEGPVTRMNVFGKNNEDVRRIEESVTREYPDLNVFTMLDTDVNSSNKWVAINPGNCSKLKALTHLVETLNISMDDVVFFGDATNDIELIKSAGLGIAMENAIDDVKNNANDVTLTNDEDGVAYYLNKLLEK